MEAKTTLECLRILQDENLFTQADVIFMQFLCRETNCLDLFEKCIEYAEKQRALCYFEKNPGKDIYVEPIYTVFKVVQDTCELNYLKYFLKCTK